MFMSPQFDRHQPPSTVASGRYLTLLALQLVAVVLGLLISRELYTTYRTVISGHDRMVYFHNEAERLSDQIDRLVLSSRVLRGDRAQWMPFEVELQSTTAAAEVLAESPVDLPGEKDQIRKQVAMLEDSRQRILSGAPVHLTDPMEDELFHLESSINAFRSGVDRMDEENLHNLKEVRQASSWNNLCEGIACLLMLVALGWAVRLYRHLRREELARFQVETELHAERKALEQRVKIRTAALESEVRERQRVERLNRGRNRILEKLARNEPVNDILQELADTLAEYRSTWACVVHTLDAGQLKLAASAGLAEKVKLHLRSINADFSGAPESAALASGKPYVIEDLGAEHRTWSELLRANGLLSVWSTPFFAPDACALGTITLYTLLQWNPTETDLEMLETASNMAALVLERSRLQNQLVEHAYHDSLTGLPNRRLGRDRLSSAANRAERTKSNMAVLWIDLNRFKQINDRYGHPVGDVVLQKTAQRLSSRLRASDTLARMGGDEFMAIIEDVDSRADAERLASQLLEILAEPMQIGELELETSASIGISMFPEDGRTVDSLAQHADQAMYAAKFGCCGLLSFTMEMDQARQQRRELEEEMRMALETDGFHLVYQPLCQPDGTLESFEALLRFRSERLGNVPPSRFIPIAEETQMIIPLGEWVLRDVCRQIRQWREEGLETVPVAVNISALQFARDDFSDLVAEILHESGEAGGSLILELTESIVMHDFEESARQMKRLKRLGVRIAVDDFGTGYSSLSYLHRLPIDILKVDGSFMETLNEPEGTRPIVEAVVSMASALGLRVVAEGVETAGQLQTLQECGCGVIQGYYFSRPVDSGAAAVSLERGVLEGGIKSLTPPLWRTPEEKEACSMAG
jgi:diguanylate cyclase (GGDEF)-like protein